MNNVPFLWYVDHIKVSQTEAKLVGYLMNNPKKNFGEFVMTRGKNYKFSVMNTNITEDKNVEIDMKYQLLEAIEAFGEENDRKLTIPASFHLVIFNKQEQQLDEENSKFFHSVVAKLLYSMKSARPDLEKSITFLCRTVLTSDVYDWKKLKRVMSWVK